MRRQPRRASLRPPGDLDAVKGQKDPGPSRVLRRAILDELDEGAASDPYPLNPSGSCVRQRW